MLLISNDAIICFNIGNKVVNKDPLPLSTPHIHSTTRSTCRSALCISCGGTLSGRRSSDWCRSGLTRSSTLCWGCSSWSWSAGCSSTVFHYYNKRSGLALCNQVIHNKVCMSLGTPACFIFTHPVLQIQNRVFCLDIFVIIRWCINVNTTYGVSSF